MAVNRNLKGNFDRLKIWETKHKVSACTCRARLQSYYHQKILTSSYEACSEPKSNFICLKKNVGVIRYRYSNTIINFPLVFNGEISRQVPDEVPTSVEESRREAMNTKKYRCYYFWWFSPHRTTSQASSYSCDSALWRHWIMYKSFGPAVGLCT
jgi:hypothetical protein